MKTDYIGHDRAYQRKRQNPAYAGWNEAASLADDWQNCWQPLIQRKHFPKTGKLLELGCGAGNISIKFAQLGYDVTGVDIASTAINWAIENAAKADVDIAFLLNDVLTLSDIEDESFDLALDGHCFHCIIGEDRTRFLQSAYRILKNNGVLAINTMCNEVPMEADWQENFDPQSRCLMHGDLATRYIGDSNDILREVINAGFRIFTMEVLPPRHSEDLADLQLIATKI
ncbi:class I SAM-dependent methyltransferase [Leptothoe spongobia]|uniref:Class I SAM-dependent methyltransferase n=1 Tax=Leptothoe spongobia TAU-MAC 1115 TaxID=1967444 RepID=A0A947DG12_9CYAN|nr:class I SAM-dependent methyltransferase [Leptothoe spongobia]MBT9316201.1 class I SAM-dependent methyltransferase [Leptothoe spongobia TAU-MAC 1115]